MWSHIKEEVYELISLKDYQLKRPPSDLLTSLVSGDLQGSDWDEEESEEADRESTRSVNSTPLSRRSGASISQPSSVRAVAPRVRHKDLSENAKTLDKQLYLVLIQAVPTSHAALVSTTALSHPWATQAFINLAKNMNLSGATARTAALTELYELKWQGDASLFEAALSAKAGKVVALQCTIFDQMLHAVLNSGLPTEAKYDVIKTVNACEETNTEVPFKDMVYEICRN